ncbi:MAG: hypothetical protein ACXWQO_15870, partial [Bdellovibrionota bacterium]
APTDGTAHGIGPSLLEGAKEYIDQSVKKYAFVAGLAFFFSLYFVAGTLMMITAAAESFDAFGFFTAGVFFYAGVGLTVISCAVLIGCYASLKKRHASKTEVKVIEPVAMPATERPSIQLGQFGHVAEALVTGIISGLVSRRLSRPSQPSSLRERIRRVV